MKTTAIFKSVVTLFLFFTLLSVKSATCVSLNDGDWANPATWSCGHVPTCGDSIVIKAGHTVTITSQQDYSGCAVTPKVAVYGTIVFTNGNKLRLPCDGVIYIFVTGSIVPGSGGGNSNFIEICGDVLWNAAAGTLAGSGCLPVTAPGCAAILPIELISFNAQINDNNKVDILWATASEKNNDYFEIQRSLNAVEFNKVGLTDSKSVNGHSQSQLSYLYEDSAPLNGVSYYRLKQIDFDKSYSYSKVVSINFIKEKNIRFVIYPNPNNGEFTADISGIENNHEVKIQLTGEKGNKVYESSFFIQDPANSRFQIVPSDKLSPGIYICTLIFEGIEYKVKVVVS